MSSSKILDWRTDGTNDLFNCVRMSNENFTFFYELYGEKFIQNLIDYFDPLSNKFYVIEFED